MVVQDMPAQEGGTSVCPIARKDFLERFDERRAIGIERYGRELHTHNGRDSWRDAMDEFMDLHVYLVQHRIECKERDEALRCMRLYLLQTLDALVDYGQHHGSCGMFPYNASNPKPCTCGLTDAILRPSFLVDKGLVS